MNAVVSSVELPPQRTARVATTGRRSIVAVSTYPLHLRQSGGQLRGWHLASALALDGDADVTVVSLTTNPAKAGEHELSRSCREICVALPPSHEANESHLRLLAGTVAITDIAAGLLWHGVPEFVSTLERSLDNAAAVVLVQPYLVDAIERLAAGIPMICDEHNDELELKQSMISPNVAGRWLLDHVDRLERTAIEHSRLVTATTEADLESLGRRYRLPAATAVVPNGVDTNEIEFVIGGDRSRRQLALRQELGLERGRPTALFVGSGHRPNIDAGRALIEVARLVPEVDFLLAGRHTQTLEGTHLPRNVRLLGLVSDNLLDLLLAGCDVALNPMSAGSGSNLKLLAYLAAGIPILSTAVGARGIDAEAAGVLLIENEDLPDGIRAVLGTSTREMTLAGRRYAEENCDWRAIGRRFAHLAAQHISS